MKKQLLAILLGITLVLAGGCGRNRQTDGSTVQTEQITTDGTEETEEQDRTRVNAFCEKYGLTLEEKGYHYQKGNRTVSDAAREEGTELIGATETATKTLEEDFIVSVLEAAVYLSEEEQKFVERYMAEGAETGVQISESDIAPGTYDFYAVATTDDKRITVGKQTIGAEKSYSFSGGSSFQGEITGTFCMTNLADREWLCLEVGQTEYHLLTFENNGMTELQIEFYGYTKEEVEKMVVNE